MFEVDNLFALAAVLGLGFMASILIFYMIVNDLFPADKIWGLKWVVQRLRKHKAKRFVVAALRDVVKAALISNASQGLMEDVGGDRADFKVLHNGGKSPSGESYRYATSKYEVVSSSTPRKAHKMQRYQIEDMPYFFETILRENVEEMSKWIDYHNIPDPMLKAYCEEYNVRSIIGFLVYSKNGDPLIYCVEWTKGVAEQFCEENPNAYIEMKNKVQSIANLL